MKPSNDNNSRLNWFSRLKNNSIEKKLTFVIMLVSTIGFLLAGLLLISYQWFNLKQQLVTEILTISQIIASNSQSTIAFNDELDAQDIINSLNSNPAIIEAIMYKKNSQILAKYQRAGISESQTLPQLSPDSLSNSRLTKESRYRFSGDHLEVISEVTLNQQSIGYIYLKSNLDNLYLSIQRLIISIIFILIFIEIIGYFISIKVQRFISQPINHLAKISRKISTSKDYSLRAEKQSNDEVGQLTEDFNQMLGKIERRNLALVKSEQKLQKTHDELEIKVKERTAELHQTNKDLELAIRRAESANIAKSNFLANMSHEIRTPMNAVLGFTELLKDSELEKKQQSYVASIQNGAKGLMTIINDVLDLSKIEAGKLLLEYEMININSFVNELKTIFEHAVADKNLKFEIKLGKTLPDSLVFDQTRVRQILFNLIGNAIKFTDSGFVRIEVKCLSEQPSRSCNNVKNQLDISFSIIDSGIGIENNQLDKIFEQFVQTEGQSHAKFGGTGLGLTICRNLAQIMNGEISVTSRVGKGSTFNLILNDISVGVDTKPTTQPAEQHIIFEPATILLVDDVKPNRTLVIEQFLDTKLNFIQAVNGLEAVEKATSDLPDLIIMDIRMPVMDGIEATKLIKENPKTKNIPIIALTASISKADENEIINNNFSDLLHKPIRKFEMINALEKVLNYHTETIKTVKKNEMVVCLDCSKADIKELLSKLKMLERRSYQEAVSSGMISSIKNFAKEVDELSQSKQNNSINLFAKKLLDAANLFDIESIESILPQYPKLILELVTQLEEYNKQ